LVTKKLQQKGDRIKLNSFRINNMKVVTRNVKNWGRTGQKKGRIKKLPTEQNRWQKKNLSGLQDLTGLRSKWDMLNPKPCVNFATPP